jgi:hypothetical protein
LLADIKLVLDHSEEQCQGGGQLMRSFESGSTGSVRLGGA